MLIIYAVKAHLFAFKERSFICVQRVMAAGRVKLFSSDISLISYILITHLLISTVRDAEYYKSGYHYSNIWRRMEQRQNPLKRLLYFQAP